MLNFLYNEFQGSARLGSTCGSYNNPNDVISGCIGCQDACLYMCYEECKSTCFETSGVGSK